MIVRKNLGEQFDYSVAVPMPYISRDFFAAVEDAESTTKLSRESSSRYEKGSSYRGMGNLKPMKVPAPPQREKKKERLTEDVSPCSYATAIDHGSHHNHHVSYFQDRMQSVLPVDRVEIDSPTQQVPRSLKKSCRTNKGCLIEDGSSDRFKNMDKVVLEDPLTVTILEEPVSSTVVNEVPESCNKHQANAY